MCDFHRFITGFPSILVQSTTHLCMIKQHDMIYLHQLRVKIYTFSFCVSWNTNETHPRAPEISAGISAALSSKDTLMKPWIKVSTQSIVQNGKYQKMKRKQNQPSFKLKHGRKRINPSANSLDSQAKNKEIIHTVSI